MAARRPRKSKKAASFNRKHPRKADGTFKRKAGSAKRKAPKRAKRKPAARSRRSR